MMMLNNLRSTVCTILFLVALLPLNGYAQPQGRFQQAYEKVKAATNKTGLQEHLAAFQKQDQQLQKILDSLERQGVRTRGEGWAITAIGDDGQLLYSARQNQAAAASTSTNLVWGGNYNLNGADMQAGIWEAGEVPRASHQEFGNRISIMDPTAPVDDHATHVAGTMIATGVNPNARGMANQAALAAYDASSDAAEMVDEAMNNGLLVSNHSYGFLTGWAEGDWGPEEGTYWWGRSDLTEDYNFGYYSTQARDWDAIAYDAPYYLIVKSAGNDRNDTAPSGSYYVRINGAWTLSTAFRENDGGADGYDCIPSRGNAKNILTVGAIRDLPNGYTNAADVAMTTFSSWGGADDGRIKPDIVGNGHNLFSSGADSNTDYIVYSGTSMSAPNVSGSLLLLQELHARETGEFMRSATLKGLAIHTADEAGPAAGPDMQFGWGVLNTKKAADFILGNDPALVQEMQEAVLQNGGSFSQSITSNGGPLRATLVWTDPEGAPCGAPPISGAWNCSKALVNDLELRVSFNGQDFFPYTVPVPGQPAQSNQPNDVDNVEQVFLPATQSGTYEIRVFHNGTLQGGAQPFSLLITADEAGGALADEVYIQNTTLAGQSKISGNNYGYADFSNDAAYNFTPGQSISLNLTAGAETDPLPVYWRIWADWNQNQVFDEPAELMIDSGPVNTLAYQGLFTVPASAAAGATRLRIAVRKGEAPPACGTHLGEVEDYPIQVAQPNFFLTLSPASLVFQSQGGQQSAALTTNCNSAWQLINAPSWVSVQPTSGQGSAAISLTAAENTMTVPRSGTVTFSACGETASLNLTQNAASNSFLSITPSSLSLNFTGSSAFAFLSTNCSSWSVLSSPPWATVAPSSGSNSANLSISYQENISSSPRNGQIVIQGCGQVATLNLEQAGAPVPITMDISPAALSVASAGGSVTANLSTNCDSWQVSPPVPAWLSVSPQNGSGDAQLVLTASSNPGPSSRSTVITLTGCGLSRQVNVSQAAPVANSISFSPSSITLGWTAGSAANGNLSMPLAAAWTATPSASWINVAPNGFGSQNLSISASSDNPSSSPRFGTVTFEIAGAQAVANITQEGQPGSAGPPWGEPTVSNKSGVFFGQAQIAGLPAGAGDWIAAFDEAGNLAGSNQVIINGGIAYISLVIYGDDNSTPGVDEGINPGEAFTLHLWDQSDNRVLDYPFTGAATLFHDWTDNNGAPMPAYNNPAAIYNFELTAMDIIPLRPGWNLVSTDVVPADSSVASIMSGLLPGNLETVTGFDVTPNFYDPINPFLSTLSHWERGFGYWVRVTGTDTLRIPGLPIPADYYKSMDAGWNLMAFIPQGSLPTTAYLDTWLSNNTLEVASGFDPTPIFYDPSQQPFLNTMNDMRNSRGYWMRLSAPGFNNGIDAREQGAYGSNVFEFIWAKAPALAGQTIRILDAAGSEVGQLTAGPNGLMRPIHIFGDSPLTTAKEGPSPGDLLSFEWNGRRAAETLAFRGDMLLRQVNLTFPPTEQGPALKAYPTPFREKVTLEVQLPQNLSSGQVHIINVSGQRVWSVDVSAGASSHIWAPKGMPPGLYTVYLQAEGQLLLQQRIVLQ